MTFYGRRCATDDLPVVVATDRDVAARLTECQLHEECRLYGPVLTITEAP